MTATLQAPPWFPKCMDFSEWRDWQRLNPIHMQIRESERAERPCQDCPASFAAEMRAIGCCNGEPGMVD